MKKRGAIELSMTTIIVIIMGVVLLSLGLMWIRGVFGDIEKISGDAFEKANNIIGELENVDSLLTVIPNEIEINQGKDDVIKVIVANFEEGPITFTIKTENNDDKLRCGFPKGDDIIETTDTYTLESGDQKDFAVIVKDKKGSIRTTSCKILIESSVENDDETLIVRVEKGKGLFG